jgi:hypothetical protein
VGDVLANRPNVGAWTTRADLLAEVANEGFEVVAVPREKRQHLEGTRRFGVVGVEHGHELAETTRPRAAIGAMDRRLPEGDVTTRATDEHVG